MSFELKNYQFSVGAHREKNVIWVQFPNNAVLRGELRQRFPSAMFSWTNKCWYLTDTKHFREEVGLAAKTVLESIKLCDIAEINRPALQRMHETLLLKGYSESTVKTYCGEIVGLKITDIDSDRMLVHIENAKGKKDRYTPLPQSILDDLRTYYKEYKPQEYLFEGQYGGQYSIRSVQAVFKTAVKKAKINKTVGIHGLRHSYATHLMEAGTDMVFIQKLLGHKDIKTTQIYAKVTNKQLSRVRSPLDDLST